MSYGQASARIETPRLVLRAPRLSDAPRIAALASDIDIARMTTRLPYPYSREDAEAFLERMEQTDRASERPFVIEHQKDGPIGMLGFHPSDGPGPEVGYWLGRDYWGQGLATEAARAAMSWAREGWGRRVVVSGHFADNPASGRVLIKAGFLYTGEIKPRHSLARDEIAPTRMMVWLA